MNTLLTEGQPQQGILRMACDMRNLFVLSSGLYYGDLSRYLSYVAMSDPDDLGEESNQ